MANDQSSMKFKRQIGLLMLGASFLALLALILVLGLMPQAVGLTIAKWKVRVHFPAGKSFSTWPLLAGLALATCLLLFYFKWSINTGLTLLTLILSVTGFALMDLFKPRRRRLIRWAVLASVTVVAARVCWQLDVARKFSGPDTWFQGHAVWHLLTGLSLAGIYFFYRSESAIERRGIAK